MVAIVMYILNISQMASLIISAVDGSDAIGDNFAIGDNDAIRENESMAINGAIIEGCEQSVDLYWKLPWGIAIFKSTIIFYN